MPKRAYKTHNKTALQLSRSHWYSRSSRYFRPALIGIALALLAGPASWLMVSAQSDNSDVGLVGSKTTAGSMTRQKTSGSGRSSQPSSVSASATSTKSSNKAAVSEGTKSSTPSTATNASSIAASPSAAARPTTPVVPTPAPASSAGHEAIISTVFWVGEAADASNAQITNTVSAWDENWQAHFGGVDDPQSRNGYAPSAFTPKENPFYFALPYSDFDNSGNRRASAGNCPNAAALAGSNASWCKNAWIRITHSGKTTYAQWEDTGPLQENDTAYVFGTARPLNSWGAKAGLDVSPAVKDYLGLQDVDMVGWSFVGAGNVPAGPWKNVVTTSLGT